MNQLLSPGQTVQAINSGQPCKVDKFLGGGGQGEVYRAAWAGGSYALKWYFPHTATPEQREALQRLISEHRPPSDQFLWPLDFVEARGVAGYGYLMRLREARYKSLVDLVAGRIDPTFRVIVTAALQLVDSFHKLHADGLCYRDISFGNAFFDPKTGDVLICDNDNVSANRSGVSGVLGTPDFMAPEIVRMEAVPSRQTDMHSLAVLLFYLFHISHPLAGKKVLSIRAWDLPSRTKLFGKEPVFIFDPEDISNAAVDRSQDPYGEAGDNALRYWPIYPQVLQDCFIKAFTTGLRDPDHGRVTEGEWKPVLSRLRDLIFPCAGCRKENFYDGGDAAPPLTRRCWACNKELVFPYRLAIGKQLVMLHAEGKLHPHHVSEHSELNLKSIIGEVARHPSDPNIWGLKNQSGERWSATMPDGSVKDVETGKSVRLSPGVKIQFNGKTVGEVLY